MAGNGIAHITFLTCPGLTQRQAACLHGWLDAGEQARLERLRVPEDRQSYLLAHAALRYLLMQAISPAPCLRGERMDPAWHGLRYAHTPQGKPELPDHPLHFNISHSGAHIAIALADVPVGVDVQTMPDDAQCLQDMARDILSPAEQRQWPRIDNATLLRTWAVKEALFKAHGSGLLQYRLTELTLPAHALQHWQAQQWYDAQVPARHALHGYGFAALDCHRQQCVAAVSAFGAKCHLSASRMRVAELLHEMNLLKTAHENTTP